ncbi:MAG: glycosyltransferase [Planctomycetaceae bacterium]|nr:glycosyltransferase [Planctomycetaceae bacterium]
MATTILSPPDVDARTLPVTEVRMEPARKRVCHLSMTLQTGGLERLLVEFGRHHDCGRYELQFVALDLLGPPADELRDLGFEVETMRFSAIGKWTMLRRLAHWLRRERIDILHTHNTYPHFYGTLAARLAGVPVVVNTQHGRGCGSGWKDRCQFRLANRVSQRVVGVSEDARTLCQAQDPRSARRMTRIWNGIDVGRFAFHGPADTLTAISVARLNPVKDFPTLLHGVALAHPQVPEFRLQIVGDGPERPRLEALREKLGLDEVVTFLGERADVPELLSRAGFFVSSSKTEGISLTLLEAMAVGLPVLTTSVGGNPEIVVEGETGRLVEPLNPDAIAAGVVTMCRERPRWEEMGRAGRDRVEQHFEIGRMIRNYEALYEEVVAEAGRGALPTDMNLQQ